jgi:hypothetical protein
MKHKYSAAVVTIKPPRNSSIFKAGCGKFIKPENVLAIVLFRE